MELRHEGSATGGKKIRIENGEESLSELTPLLAGYGAPTRGLCNRRTEVRTEGEESLRKLTQLFAGYGAPTRGLCT
jgi:hypothetical protein